MGIFNVTNITKDSKFESTEPVTGQNSSQVNTDSSELSSSVDSSGDVKKVKTVTMTGPLSKIYSEALNLVYGKESITNMIDPETISSEISSEDDVAVKDLYVFTVDGEHIDGREIVKMGNDLRLALDSKKYKKVILAVEGGVYNRKITLLSNLATDMGVTVTSDRETALKNMKALLT